MRVMMWRVALGVLPLAALPPTAGAAVSEAAVNVGAAQNLFSRCDRRPSSGSLESEELRGYLLALNEPLFEQYDLDCSGDLAPSERDKYLADERRKAEERLANATTAAERRILETHEERSAEPVVQERALRITPEAELNKMSLAFSFSNVDKPTEQKDTTNFSLSAEQKPLRITKWDVPISILLDVRLSLKRDELRTAALSTETEELSFTPLSFKTTDEDERFEFKFSAGRGLVQSEKVDLQTGAREKERNSTYAYKLDATYNMGAAKCWSIGLSYEIKTDELFSSTVSSTFGPTFGYNLLCSDDDEQSARSRVTPLGLFAPGVN